jgi:UPF0755 protein
MAKARRGKKDKGYRTAVSGAKGLIRILVYVCLAVVLIFLGREAYALGYEVFYETPVDEGEGREVTVTITEEMSVMDIGGLLQENGLIDERPLAFWIQERLSEYHDKLLPGTYILNTSQSVEEMLEILAQVNTEGQPEQNVSDGSGENAGTGETGGEGGTQQ